MQYRYHLAKYAGKSSRLTCPQCERPHCFTPYVDEDGTLLDPTVGRCDHESSCGYHLTPGQFFHAHPEARPQGDAWRQPPRWLQRSRHSRPASCHSRADRESLCILPADIVRKTLRTAPKSTLIEFLETIFDAATLERLWADYRLGVTRDRSVVFYQIDIQGRVRTGKIMQYNPADGHRVKNVGVPVDWVHARLKKSGALPESWTVTQCLFGEHLLPHRPDDIVCLVESEKTALIGSGFCPQYVWLATGGKTQLGPKLSVLQGRKVLVFPDIDATKDWEEKLSAIPGLNLTISTILEYKASPEDRTAQIDIAFCQKHMFLAGNMDQIERIDTLTVPIKALREATLNLLVHRTWWSCARTPSVAIYDDRIEFMNPGSFPPGTTAEDFRKRPHSEPINEVISSVFFKSGLMEAWGRGIPDIFNECKAAGLPTPEFESIPYFVCLTIRFKNPLTPYLTDQNNSSSNERLNPSLQATLDIIKANPGIKRKDIVATSDKGDATIGRHLVALAQRGLIEHKNSKKTGGYYAK